jgi:hypothetical protein
MDANNNMIPDRWDRRIALVLTVIVGVLILMRNGAWFGSDATVWFTRVVEVIALLSSVFGWGMLARPGKGS